MIREPLPSHSDDEAFNAIIKNAWETGPSLRETIDPGILRLLNDAKNAETALNSDLDDPSEDAIQDTLISLNSDWESLGLNGAPIKVTGRLRPTAYALEEDVVDHAREGALPGISELKDDTMGEYFDGANFEATIDGFDVEKVPMGEHGSIYRLVMLYRLSDEYDDNQIWFTSYPDDVEYIEPHEPTREGVDEYVRANLSEIFAQIQTLPDNCRNPEAVRRALDDFCVTIDFSKLDGMIEKDKVIDLVETCITDHIAFDNATYDANVQGTIYGRTMKYEQVPKEYKGTLRELLISNVCLAATPESDDGQSSISYRPVLETWYLVPESQGGRTPIYIPLDSLTGLTANRPEAEDYPFSEDTIIQPNEQFDENFEAKPFGQDLGMAVLDVLAHLEDGAENNELGTGEDRGTPESEIERERLFLKELRDLHHSVGQLVSSNIERSYPTRVLAEADYEIVNKYVADFFERWKARVNAVIEVTGEGLRLSNATITHTIDHDNETVDTRIKGFDVVPASSLNNAKGTLTQAHVRVGPCEVDGVTHHVIRAYLEFTDVEHDNRTRVINDPDINVPIVSLETSRQFFVDLGLPVGYSIPSVEYDDRRNEALANVARLDIEQSLRVMLRKNLLHLAHAIDNGSDKDLTEYGRVGELSDIGRKLQKNEQAMTTVADTLEAILHRGRPLQVIGPYIDETGDQTSDQGLFAILDGVITEHPFLDEKQIAFVMLIPAQEPGEVDSRYVVPLSTLEEMAFIS
ncbi:hypothetical protein FBF30_02305 [Candidatus Saccharibacteria bacterium oral taxon 955]|nr:hypothetical protein FBF30_02305 [Candidatus Saccharibacteria bacterium oral taxon 955]